MVLAFTHIVLSSLVFLRDLEGVSHVLIGVLLVFCWTGTHKQPSLLLLLVSYIFSENTDICIEGTLNS